MTNKKTSITKTHKTTFEAPYKVNSSRTKKPARKPKTAQATNTIEQINQTPPDAKEPRVSEFELGVRLLIATVVSAASIATIFFPPTTLLSPFIIAGGLAISSAIIRKPALNYMHENPTSYFAKFVTLLTGVRDKVRYASHKITRDEHAFENILIQTASTRNKKFARVVEGIETKQVLEGNGTKEQEQRFLKKINNNIPTSTNKTAKESLTKAALKESKKYHRQKSAKEKETDLVADSAKKSLSKHRPTEIEMKSKHPENQAALKQAKQALSDHGIRDFKRIPPDQLKRINKLATPRPAQEKATGPSISKK